MRQVPEHILSAVCGLLGPYCPGLTGAELVRRLESAARPAEELPGPLFTVPEVARVLKCTPAHVYRLMRDGVLGRRVKIGRCTRISRESVEALMSGRQRVGGAV
jgi:excisionase family DNA binding protein